MRKSITKKERIFAFGKTQYIAKITILIPCKIGNRKCFIETYIVEGEIPWLVGKESLKRMGAVLDLERMKMWVRKYKINLDLRNDKNGHLKVKLCEAKRNCCWADQVIVNQKKEAKKVADKLHRQFGHPGQDKLWRTVKEAELVKDFQEGIIKECIKEISEKCQICAKFKKTPSRPVVGLSMGEDFNDCVSIDLGMYSDGNIMMIMVDVVTKFSQAAWLKSKKPEEITRTLLSKWIAVFGSPRIILTDNGGEFQNDEMLRLAERFDIEMKSTSSESPWSNGICERVVGRTKELVRKIKEESGADLNVCLDWAMNARNSLCNRNGFSSYQLVFGRNPNVRNVEIKENYNSGMDGKESKILKDTISAITSSRINQMKFDNNEKVKIAMRANIREHLIEDAQIGEKVLYKREGEDSWRGPAKVIGVDGKTVIVKHGGLIREVNRIHSTRIKKFMEEEEGVSECDNNIENETERENIGKVREGGVSDDFIFPQIRMDNTELDDQGENEALDIRENIIEEDDNDQIIEEDIEVANQNQIDCSKLKVGERVSAKDVETGIEIKVKILGRAGKVGGKYGQAYNVEHIDSGEKEWINFKNLDQVTKIEDGEEIWLENWRRSDIDKAKQIEIDNWKENNVFEVSEDTGQKILSSRWVITEKIKDGKKIVKARLVVRGFEEEGESEGIDSPTCKPEVLKIALSIMKMKGWKIRSIDIKTAYLQGDKIEREVFIRPPKDWKTGENQVWKLNKAVYGLKDAARMWFNKVKKTVTELGGCCTSLEPTLFKFENRGELIGIICSHVDDFCYGGNERFLREVIGTLKSRLKVGDEETGNFRYIGVKIHEKQKEIILEQGDYVKSIDEVEWAWTKTERVLNKKEMKVYRGIVGQLNWVAQQTRPDISFAVSDLSRHCKNASSRDMRRLMKVVKYTKSQDVNIKIGQVKEGQERVVVFSDAAFGNIDLHSQIGYIIGIEDGKGNRCPVMWKSAKGKRIAKSTSEAEILGVGEAAEAGVWLKELWKEITGRVIDVEILTDSSNIQKILNSITGSLSKRMRIDVAAMREMIQRKEVECVKWVPTEQQIADVLTKDRVNREQIIRYIGGN